MLTQKEIAQIKEELDSCKKPLFFFHDDPDGLSSFLLLYRYLKEGKGMPIKAVPNITSFYVKKVEEYDPDKIFVLDIALVEQEFIDLVKRKIIWIDHHTPQSREKVLYFNPRAHKEQLNIPTPYLCRQVTQSDLWIATVGCIGDWYWPDFAEEFRKQYPSLLPESVKTVEDALFNSPVGKIVKMFSFNLKGASKEVYRSIKVLTRINDPVDLFEARSSAARFINKKFEKINSFYEQMLATAKSKEAKDNFLVYTYQDDKLSLTKDIANELSYVYPKKIIIVGREKDDELRCSLRARAPFNLLEAFQKAMIGIEGYGGGHEQAVGCAIKKHNFNQFVDNLRKQISL